MSERLPGTVAAPAARLGWEGTPELPRLNRSAGSPAVAALAPLDRLLLDEPTALDQRLHRAAGRRLDALRRPERWPPGGPGGGHRSSGYFRSAPA